MMFLDKTNKPLLDIDLTAVTLLKDGFIYTDMCLFPEELDEVLRQSPLRLFESVSQNPFLLENTIRYAFGKTHWRDVIFGYFEIDYKAFVYMESVQSGFKITVPYEQFFIKRVIPMIERELIVLGESYIREQYTWRLPDDANKERQDKFMKANGEVAKRVLEYIYENDMDDMRLIGVEVSKEGK